MFPVLTTDSLLSTLGLGTLSDAISCEVEEERNGSYELTLEYPQGGAHADDIALNALIVAKPNFTDNPQPFRIYSITKEISGKIEVHAQHISYDLGGVVVSPTTMTGATCKQAGDYLLTGTPFTFQTDKTNSADFKVDVPSSARSWLGGKSGSLLSVYGSGEYHYDGYNVVFNAQRGTNRGVELRYGKNLTELKSEADCSNLASSVVCYYEENGTVTSGTAVSTGLVGITRELAIDVSDDYNTAPSVATLTARATQYIADHNLTAPKTNITLDFVQASKLKDRVDLCDTVSIYYEALGVSAVTKCIRTVWDVLAERYTETEFGDAKTNIADTIVEVEQVAAESVTKTIMQQAIDSATEQITGNNGGYVVLHDANNDGFPDELLIMDTADISTAVKIWRFNSSGLGYSSTGYSGTYGLAITQNGAIVADFITAGTLNANVIRAGIITDAQGYNSWNLDTGAFNITNGSLNIYTNNETNDYIGLSYLTNANYLFRTGLSASGLTTERYPNYDPSQIVTDDEVYVTGTGISVGYTHWQMPGDPAWYGNPVTKIGRNDLLFQRVDTGTTPHTLTPWLELRGNEIYLYDNAGTLRSKMDGNGWLSLYESGGTLSAQIKSDGLRFYDIGGDLRFELDRTGDAILRINNGAGTTRTQWELAHLYFYDGSSVQRADYAYNKLDYYNSSGQLTATYPSARFENATIGGVSAYSTRSTIVNGGAYRLGNLVFVCFHLRSSYTATNSPRMATINFTGALDCPLTCIDITNGIASEITESVPCGVAYNGAFYMKKATNGHIYAITGFFPYYP